MKCLVKGRHDPSRRARCDLWRHALSTIRNDSCLSPTDHTVPYGTGFWITRSRHSMPGYHHLVPPGQRYAPRTFFICVHPRSFYPEEFRGCGSSVSSVHLRLEVLTKPQNPSLE